MLLLLLLQLKRHCFWWRLAETWKKVTSTLLLFELDADVVVVVVAAVEAAAAAAEGDCDYYADYLHFHHFLEVAASAS